MIHWVVSFTPYFVFLLHVKLTLDISNIITYDAVMNKQYINYMSSDRWRVKRQLVLERDNHECQTCLHKGEHYPLQGHHKTYERFGNEDPYDLIILCKSCHEAITNVIRERRYARVNPDDIVQTIEQSSEKFIGSKRRDDECPEPEIIKSKQRYLPPSRKDKENGND